MRSFSDRKLKQVIASREKRWWAFLSANDKYDEGRLDYDDGLLRQFYLARGYADIQVQRARGGLLPDRGGFAITFLVSEGVRYQVDKISVSSGLRVRTSMNCVSLSVSTTMRGTTFDYLSRGCLTFRRRSDLWDMPL